MSLARICRRVTTHSYEIPPKFHTICLPFVDQIKSAALVLPIQSEQFRFCSGARNSKTLKYSCLYLKDIYMCDSPLLHICRL